MHDVTIGPRTQVGCKILTLKVLVVKNHLGCFNTQVIATGDISNFGNFPFYLFDCKSVMAN